MNTGRHLHAIARSLLPALLLAACNLRGQPASPPISPPAATSPAVTSPAAVEHRIGIRLVDGAGEFYDRVTGAKFTPRGMNYIHLAEQPTDDGGRTVYHSLFDPGRYEPALVGEALEKMKEAGYNTVRVFMSQNTIDAPDGGLSDEYLANMADFITQAVIDEGRDVDIDIVRWAAVLHDVGRLDWLGEARPARPGVVLIKRAEKRLA